MAGNGQNELMEIFLNENNDNFKGDIIFKNQNINQLSTQDRKRLLISYVTEQRLGHSAVPEMSLTENVLLSMSHNKKFIKNDLINFKEISNHTDKIIKKFLSKRKK